MYPTCKVFFIYIFFRLLGEMEVRAQMARDGWIAYLNFLQSQLDKLVSKINGKAILSLAQLSYTSHLHNSSK